MLNKHLVVLLTLFNFFLFPLIVNAQGASFKLTQPEGLGIKVQPASTPYAESYVERIVGNVVGIFFAVGGIGVVVYFVWGAVDWILSGGDKEKVSNARKKMTNAIIGLALLSLSYVIINIIGQIVGFNPLGYLQLRYLGTDSDKVPPVVNQ